MESQPNPENCSLEELKKAIESSPTQRGFMRLTAIHALLMGVERSVVCAMFFRSDRVVRLWIEMFNRGGIDALASKPRVGRPRKIKLQRASDLLLPVLENPSQAGEVHWTGVKLHGWLKENLGFDLGYSTTLRYLHELGYNLRVPRPWPERQDEVKRQAFLEKFRLLQQEPETEIWFTDECGVEGDPRPRRRWSARGSRPKVPYLGQHIRSNVIGAVCPQSGEFFSLIFNGVDTQVFQCYLDHLAENVPAKPSKRYILILDNASWHKSKSLNWHHFEPHFLPPYSPDFNPIERLWLRLKSDFFSDFISPSLDVLNERLCAALCHFMHSSQTVASQCAFRK